MSGTFEVTDYFNEARKITVNIHDIYSISNMYFVDSSREVACIQLRNGRKICTAESYLWVISKVTELFRQEGSE